MDAPQARYQMAHWLQPSRLGMHLAAALCAGAMVLCAAAAWSADPPALSVQAQAGPAVSQLKPKKPLPASVQLPVQSIYQWPELPNGCEATSLAMLLQCYGFSADKQTLAYDYIPRQEFARTLFDTYGPDPEQAYAGDPADDGFYCFAGALQAGANAYLAQAGSDLRAVDITGCTAKDLRATLAQGRPVVVWATIEMEEPRLTESFTWLLSGSGETYHPYANLHCLLLYGYDEEFYYLMDPLTGARQVPRLLFEARWSAMGCRALVLDGSMDRAPYRTWEDSCRKEDLQRLLLPGQVFGKDQIV